MDKIYYTILNTNDIEFEYNSIVNPKLKLVFGFMIATMFKFNIIEISQDFGVKLYLDLVNGHDDVITLTDKIYDYVWDNVINNAIDAIEKEINE